MPQLPDIRQHIAAWADAAQSGPTQVLHAVSELAERGLQASGDWSAGLIELAGRARMRLAMLPSTMPAVPALPGMLTDEIRRRMNPLGLVTQADIELQSRRQRSRVAALLKEFLEAQRGRDEALRDALLTELREQLQSFASAIDDDTFDLDEPLSSAPRRSARRDRVDFDYMLDDDDLDMTDYEEIVISEDERMAIRRTLLSANELDDD